MSRVFEQEIALAKTVEIGWGSEWLLHGFPADEPVPDLAQVRDQLAALSPRIVEALAGLGELPLRRPCRGHLLRDSKRLVRTRYVTRARPRAARERDPPGPRDRRAALRRPRLADPRPWRTPSQGAATGARRRSSRYAATAAASSTSALTEAVTVSDWVNASRAAARGAGVDAAPIVSRASPGVPAGSPAR